MENEIWKDIAGHEGRYQVSNYGKVRSFDMTFPNTLTNGLSVKKGKVLNPWLERGYPRVALLLNKKHVFKSVHSLVAKAFVEAIEGKKHINHIDGNP